MTRYQCTCALDNGEKNCPVHKKRTTRRDFYKYYEEENYFNEADENEE